MSVISPSSETDKDDNPLPLWLILMIPVYVIGLMSVIIFPIAGDWMWVEGWLFIATLAINLGIS
jgi:hypothetical protein